MGGWGNRDRRKGLACDGGLDFPLMGEGRKGQRVGASLGSLGMSHQGMGEWRVDGIWR